MQCRNSSESVSLVESLEARALFSATVGGAESLAGAATTEYRGAVQMRLSASTETAARNSPEAPSPIQTNLVVIAIIGVLIG